MMMMKKNNNKISNNTGIYVKTKKNFKNYKRKLKRSRTIVSHRFIRSILYDVSITRVSQTMCVCDEKNKCRKRIGKLTNRKKKKNKS